MTLVGALGRETRAAVDARGRIAVVGARWGLDWWIGADDRWRIPAEEVAVRQELVEEMPVVRTALRVPDGDAVERVFGVADGSIVIEVENASPAAFALTLVFSDARSVAVEGGTVVVDGSVGLTTERPPRRWAAGVRGVDEPVREVVLSGRASGGDFPALRDRKGRIEAAFLYPVAHRTTFRATLLEAAGDPGRDGRAVPNAADVARGWLAQLERGMRVELGDPRSGAAVNRARAQALLRAGMTSDPDLLAALEDWGFDDEAQRAWERASLLDRWRARRRRPVADGWSDPDDDARFLRVVRDRLARETADGVDILRTFPDEWRGVPLEVHDAPLRAGPLSFALRWHGSRPALLWEAPVGTVVRAPGLAPGWSTMASTGETLLNP